MRIIAIVMGMLLFACSQGFDAQVSEEAADGTTAAVTLPPTPVNSQLTLPEDEGTPNVGYYAVFYDATRAPPSGIGVGGVATRDGVTYGVHVSFLFTGGSVSPRPTQAWNWVDSAGAHQGVGFALPCLIQGSSYSFPVASFVETGPVPAGEFRDWLLAQRSVNGERRGSFQVRSRKGLTSELYANYRLGDVVSSTIAYTTIGSLIGVEQGYTISAADQPLAYTGSWFTLRNALPIAGEPECQLKGVSPGFNAMSVSGIGGIQDVWYSHADIPRSVSKRFSKRNIPVVNKVFNASEYQPSSFGARLVSGSYTQCPPGTPCN
jgi:hypothetical protein